MGRTSSSSNRIALPIVRGQEDDLIAVGATGGDQFISRLDGMALKPWIGCC
jgi:hypothetical protein